VVAPGEEVRNGAVFFWCFFGLSLMSYNSHHKRRERRARNIAGAEALAVARSPEEASRERWEAQKSVLG